MYLIILIILTPPPSQTNDVTLYVWQSFLSPLWAGTGMHVSSHTLARCDNLLALYCGTNVDQRLVIWLYMSNTISGPSPPHCSASLPAAHSRPCSTCKSIVVFCWVRVFVLFLFFLFFLKKMHANVQSTHGTASVLRFQCLWAGIGGGRPGFSNRHEPVWW